MKAITDNPKVPASKPEPKPKSPESKSGSKPDATNPKHDLKTLPMPEVEKQLGASPDGLSQIEAQKRLAKYGPNEIAEKKTNAFLKFLSYFWGPIPWMIEAAVILSGVVRHWLDFFIILFLLFSNAVVAFWEEHQAGNEIAALKAKLATKTTVKRDGKWVNPVARELVPGDVVRLRLGDIVPADARLLAGDPVQVDQSALTGESLPATRKPGEAVFSGSIIKRGEADAMVYATGTNTYFGKTAQLVQEATTVSHFQRAVLRIGDYLIVLAVALVAVIVTTALFRHDPILSTLEFALVLLVAAIPVAMPTVLSVTMAVGARLLAKKQAIVTKLSAIEELAGVDVLCSDKTGTLTQNKLTLGDPFCVNKIPADQVILWAALASRAEDKDTIDLAVIGAVKDDKALKAFQVLHFQPFDPVHKRTEATVKASDGKEFFVAKGAPQVILGMATNAAEVKAAVEKAVNEFAGRGFRSLGVARADQENKWQFVGLLPMFDPPREQAKATIASAGQMGVKVKMVTGDQLAIAQETARQLGMGSNILDATVLRESKNEESAQSVKSIEKADGFAQVFPEDKYNIVDVLQKHGHIVGMTGDGVNDAPALKKADCGIAVSGATDAARAAASIVLLAPGLSVIIDAIKESRRIFQRMNSYAIYRIAETLRVLFFMTLAILVFNFYPVTAVMIVMIAVLNDGAILSIAYDNVHYKNQPEAWNMRLVLGISTVLGVIGVVAAFGLFYLGERVFHLDHGHVQTLMYLKLSVAGHLTIFLTRTRGPFWSIRPARILWIAVLGTQTIATLIAVYGLFMTPLGWRWAGFVWAYALVWFLVNDRVKLLAYRIFGSAKTAMPQPEATAEAKPDANTQLPSLQKPEPKPAAKAESKPDANAMPDLTPQITKRAYELYEERGRKAGHAVQDWEKAEQEIKKDETKAEAPAETKAEPQPEGKVEPTPKTKVEPTTEIKAVPKPEAKAGPRPDAKAEPKTEATAGPKSQAKANPPADLNLQIVKRVHELYEELGREDVRAVEEWEKAEQKAQENKPHK
ncbi:MAG TPA: plasma-membrane proton-efflux P-type ATPase [Candidatus Acidoferrales bacterium]|nr:plasma-membrane proton-efflux P-type ATPase [Candidatus Acidoferrales bacterium]